MSLPLNIRLALWISHLLCPKIGAQDKAQQSSMNRSDPDFISARDIAAANGAFRRYSDEDYEVAAEWAEYCARQTSTTHHLERCLDK